MRVSRTCFGRRPAAALTLAVGLALCLTQISGLPHAHAESPTNGSLLYPHWAGGELKTIEGASSALGFSVGRVAGFSPDGALIASVETRCQDANCDTQQSVVVVRGNDGTTTTLAAVPGSASDLAWSPDQNQVVLLTGSPYSDIWRVGLDGSPAVRVLASTASFRIETEGLDWSPTADTIAFVGTPLSDGVSLGIDTGQLYTVGAEGGATTKYSRQLPECEFPSCRLIRYSEPAFSPDGTEIAAFVIDEYENFDTGVQRTEEYLGHLSAGQFPTTTRLLQTITNASSWTHLQRIGPVWSADGGSLLYGQTLDGSVDDSVSGIVPVSGGSLQRLADPDYADWQPCPSGVCAAWGEPLDDCTITGTDGDDRLTGTAGRDVICGLGGNDVLFGLEGADVLRGGDGEDDLIGGPGADVLEGDGDSDALRGDEGDDLIIGGAGLDLVTYFTSRTTVTVDLGKQRAQAGPMGNDRLLGVEGAFGSKTGDLLIGSSASNHLYGGPGDDLVKGMGGTDRLVGNAGADRLQGGGGGDLLEGSDGGDRLDGGPARDACYDTTAARVSCELGKEGDPKGGTAPVDGPDDGQVDPDAGARGALRVAGGLLRYWYIGNSDYLVVYDQVATQQVGSWASTPSWESQACRFVRYTPARGACSAAGVLNAVSKYQMKWFLWNAKTNGGCAIGILDWGRHGVNQLKQRWKVRSADYYRYNVAIPWVTPGKPTYVKVGGGALRVTC